MSRDGIDQLGKVGIGSLLLLASVLAQACTPAPSKRFELASLKITGNTQLDDADIEEHIASRETPKFLGLFPGVIYDYEVFNRFVLERDLQRIQRLYQARGYYHAHARAGRVFRSGSKVRVEIVVEEGKPVLLRRVDLHGVEQLPPELRAQARAAVTAALPIGEPLDEDQLEEATEALTRTLADNGYAQATVRPSADVNLPENRAAAGFWVEAGTPSELGEVKLQGLADLPEDRVRRAMDLEPGMVFSQSELDESKRALLDLGVFSSVEIEPQVDAAKPGPNGKPRVPILVKLEKAKLRSVRLGGGVLVDALKSDVHLTLGWEDQSFFGGLRKLQIDVTPGVVLHPTRFPSLQTPERLLPHGRFRTEFRQPGFITGRMNLVLKGQVAAYPVLPSEDYDPEAPIIGYFDYRASAGLERTYYRLYSYLAQNVQVNVPFNYKPPEDRDLGMVLVSYPSLYTTLDLRDHSIQPHKGLFLSNQLEVAGLGGDARDVKVQPEVRAYLPVTKRITLALRGSVGLLFAQNYGKTVENNALHKIAPGDPSAEGWRKDWVNDIQLMFLRGLFAGGPGSNRGYTTREIGPHGQVPFYNHGQSLESVAMLGSVDCAQPNAKTVHPAVCDVPLGGFTLWEASIELRYPIEGALSGTVFTDAADVSYSLMSFRWRPHLSSGAGLRYDTPVGAIRFDLGFRLPGLQHPPNAPDEGVPNAGLFGLPMAASFGIGEAY